MAVNIAINGFGRIGKSFLRAVLLDKKTASSINVVAINIGPSYRENTALLFKYDSIMGAFPGDVTLSENILTINNKPIKIFAEHEPEALPWDTLNIDWVVEASGYFTTKQETSRHISSGAKNVLITAPSKDPDVIIVPGVNDHEYDKTNHRIVSLGSCTTNCFAPLVKILNDTCGIEKGFMSTTHAYTNTQSLLDGNEKDARRARAAAINIIPTSTGASKVITKLFPDLEGKLHASAIRVPVANISLLEFVFLARKEITNQAVNKAFKDAADGPMQGIVHYQDQPLVSSDYIGNTHSCVFDSLLTQCHGTMGKVSAWYDNEFGYSCRLKDFLVTSEQ